MIEGNTLQKEQGEKLESGPKIIGVIGPHGIGKDTLISSLINEISGVRSFSIGQYVRNMLYNVEDKDAAARSFAIDLDNARVESEDARLNKLTRMELVDEIKRNFENRLPIPEEVAYWILKGFLNECPDDTKVVLQSGGPYGELDYQLMEKGGHPPSALILLAPSSQKWMEKIPEREQMEDPENEWEKWKDRVKKVLRLAHKRNIPVMHVNMENPNLSKEELNERLVKILGKFIDKVSKGEQKEQLSVISVK